MLTRSALFAALLFTICGSLGLFCAGTQAPELSPLPEAEETRALSYRGQVQPVLNRRCVVCHGCYDAPCQLLLSSRAGLERGASKSAVYHSDRLAPMEPTRLGIDARSAFEWRERGFFSVLEPPAGGPGVLLNMLALGRATPLAPDQKLPASMPLDITRKLFCPKPDEFESYAREHPLGGMPYGMAPLSDGELGVLSAWVQRDAAGPGPAPLSSRATADVAAWETFLNGPSLKQRLTARYLYEHWLFAHFSFEDLPAGPFFRLVRSRTPPGIAADEIATRRPYDDPGTDPFWYRLVPLGETIVHKTHIVYRLSPAKMQRLRALFLESDWEPTRFPVYGAPVAANPFVSFDEIPARSRYQFLLDDAQYFVMTFIRGPVCHGQVAVDVIQDRFFVAFLDPDHDMSVVDPDFLEAAGKWLSLPAEHESGGVPGLTWIAYSEYQRHYLDLRERYYDRADPDGRGPSLEFLWDGDGHNRNALLTVFRNFDNAMVVRGFLGGFPKTAWVIDFPLFERIYYDLVAGFDVFGDVGHQLSTRLYMDHLRMQSEDVFLAFLPADRREAIRASWYLGATNSESYKMDDLRGLQRGTRVPYRTQDVTAELLQQILARNPRVSGPPDLLNRCPSRPCERPGASALERRAERALRELAGVRGSWVATLPELTFLRVRDAGDGASDAVYTLTADRAHTNVASPFKEDERRLPERDTVTVARGYLGSYPNFLFEVPVAEIETFVQALLAVSGAPELEVLVERWGVRRTSPRFWSSFDWIHDDFRRRQPTLSGLLDLNRYQNL